MSAVGFRRGSCSMSSVPASRATKMCSTLMQQNYIIVVKSLYLLFLAMWLIIPDFLYLSTIPSNGGRTTYITAMNIIIQCSYTADARMKPLFPCIWKKEKIQCSDSVGKCVENKIQSSTRNNTCVFVLTKHENELKGHVSLYTVWSYLFGTPANQYFWFCRFIWFDRGRILCLLTWTIEYVAHKWHEMPRWSSWKDLTVCFSVLFFYFKLLEKFAR